MCGWRSGLTTRTGIVEDSPLNVRRIPVGVPGRAPKIVVITVGNQSRYRKRQSPAISLLADRRPRSAVALDACRLVHADQSLRCLPCFFARCSYVRRYRPLPLIPPPPLPHQSLAPYSHSGSRHRGGYALLAPHGALHVDRSHRKAHTTPKRL